MQSTTLVAVGETIQAMDVTKEHISDVPSTVWRKRVGAIK